MTDRCEPQPELRGVEWFNNAHIMGMWDSWRRYIAEGGGASWPRDAFECLLDAHDAEVEALRMERDWHKSRGDNHAETLRGIARMDPKTEADRMVLWARDGLSGYTQSAEATLKEAYDERNTLRARVAELERIVRLLAGFAETAATLDWDEDNNVTWAAVVAAEARAALSPKPTE